MRETKRRQPLAALTRLGAGLAALAFGVGAQAALTINVTGPDGVAITDPDFGFKFIVQEDSTYPVNPPFTDTNPPPARVDMLSFNFHASNHPVALTGNADGTSASATVPNDGRYYVSVLPYSGYQMSGQPVEIVGGNGAVTVVVERHPIPTAQIAIFLFEDNYPLNGTPDLPEEENTADAVTGLGPDGFLPLDWTQFSITLEDPAGLYGQQGGPVLQDAFGNPLGTVYEPAGCDYNGGTCTTVTPGDGTLHPDENGYLLVKNLAPGKYGVIVNAPGANPSWQQTSTIEGTIVIDAWVKANEPPFFVEFGLPGPHAFVGFVRQDRIRSDLLSGGATISGTITDMHMSRPPEYTFWSGRPFPQCWVALNEGGVVPGRALFAGPCDGNSGFSIAGVPDGSYQLKVFDTNLDMVIATLPVDIVGGNCNLGAGCALGEVAVFNWFHRMNAAIFNDVDQDGFWDPTEGPVGPEAGPVGIRWRNGAAYQAFPTDNEGFAPFDEVFPFFHWLVAEVGFANKKPTGATFVVDAGGEIVGTDAFPDYSELTPQVQAVPACDPTAVPPVLTDCSYTGGTSRTETGVVLTQAFQGFLGQTNVMQFGKTEYIADLITPPGPGTPPTFTFVGENGGISGVVHYAITRAENDPRYAVADTWEPGIPRVQVALYADGDINCPPLNVFPGAGGTPAGDLCDIDWNVDGVQDPNLGQITDINGGGVTLADVDNYPLGWAEGGAMGPEDIDNNTDANGGRTGVFDLGDALQVAWSDSWDDNTPTNCGGANQIDVDLNGIITPEEDARCFDGLRNFNQVRPGVFDGGWAFADYDLTHLPAAIAAKLTAFYANRIGLVGNTSAGIPKLPEAWIIPGDYIVEAATPPGYKLVKEEDKNVDFGDEYFPSPQAVDVPCVGDLRDVPPYLSFATKNGSGLAADLIPGFEDATTPLATDPSVAGDERPLCNRKSVGLSAAQNAATNFFFFTDTPIGANATGVILNDLANEFNPNSPNFGEKYAPPYVPVGFYDWAGNQVNRVYADEFGRYNAVLPSTYTVNIPMPSGMSPNMLVSCMNDAGPIPNPEFCAADPCPPGTDPNVPETILDPSYNPQFSQFCYTFQYMPGDTTYLDTPVEAIASFTNPTTFPVDCEQPTRTPMIASVERSNNSRPVGAPVGSTGPFVVNNTAQSQQIIIRSLGQQSVPNPNWDGTVATPKTITRDYRFGPRVTGSTVILTPLNGGTPTVLSGAGQLPTWNQNVIVANVPTGLALGDYQVTVTRGPLQATPAVQSPIGVTLTVGRCSSNSGSRRCNGTENGVRPNATFPYSASELFAVRSVAPAGGYPATPIQDVIDAAAPGDLILVAPGTYEELVIMWKPVKLQGWGAGRVTLNARQVPTEKILDWRAKVQNLADPNGDGVFADGLIDLLPGQELAPAGFQALGAPLFPTEEGAGIFVAGKNAFPDWFSGLPNRGARIDGFTIVGASQGGAIVLNGYNSYMNIGNNRLTGNAGFYSGGIRLGHPTLFNEVGGLNYTDAQNDNVRIHHNLVVKNGGLNTDAVGGGIGLMTGADNYRVQQNWVCGNFTAGSGAGVGHLGFSDNGLIEDNQIVFNESFSQATPESGGGLYIGGQPALQATGGYLVSPGTGTVTVDANLIRGNLAGAGDGGGIRLENVNGADVVASPTNAGPWSDIYLFNNMVTNNVAGLAGGGVSIENTVSAWFRHNTIANNDSTATTALAFTVQLPGGGVDPNLTAPQPAGLVSRAHSGAFALLMAGTPDVAGNDQDLFSNPELRSNIVDQNRSFYWVNSAPPAVTSTGLEPADCTPTSTATCIFDDLAVLGVDGGLLNPVYSLLTEAYAGGTNNLVGVDPLFVNPYLNGPRDQLNLPEFTTIQTSAAFDEGGNFIQVAFGPLTLLDTSAQPITRTMFDYHLGAGSPAIDTGSPNNAGGTLGTLGSRDFDNDPRGTSSTDIGADELIAP